MSAKVFAPVLEKEEGGDHLSDPAREREAEAVSPCVASFVTYELEPPVHGKGVGRFAPTSLTPPIGSLLGRADVRHLDPGVRDALASALVDALAIGYVGIAALEAGGHGFAASADANPEEIWRLWVVRLNGETLEGVKVDRDFQNQMRNLASDRFVASVRQLGLFPRVRKRTRFRLVGQWYGQAGMLLRLVHALENQLDVTEDVHQLVNTWPLRHE